MNRLISGAIFLCRAAIVSAEDVPGAKALFYSGEGTTISPGPGKEEIAPPVKEPVRPPPGPADQPKREKYMGIAYWIDLVGKDGSLVKTTTRREFRTGERIKLNFKSNRDGYLYVVNLGTTGTSRVMFPRPNQGDNYVKANRVYSVPEGSHMTFDDNPGVETLLVLLAPQPLPGLAPSSAALNAAEIRKFVTYAETNGAKDLILEDDEKPARANPAQYVVAPASALARGKVISLRIKLKHAK